MDHLPLPRDPAAALPRVPYICGDVDECHDFLEFHRSFVAEWKVYLPPGDVGTQLSQPWLLQAAKRIPHGVAVVEAFLQRWIFFGLLRELFAPADLFNSDEYVGTDDQGKFLQTVTLVGRVENLIPIYKAWDEERRIAFSDRMCACLDQARLALSSFYQFNQEELDQNDSIKVSLVVLCEAIGDCAAYRLSPSPGVAVTYGYCNVNISNQLSTSIMLKNGWCRSEIKPALGTYFSPSGQLFLHNMQRPALGLDHTLCTEEECLHLATNLDTYTPRHTTEHCVCEYVGPDPAAVAACLDAGTFPVLRIVKNGDNKSTGQLALEVVPYTENAAYVALSHVWADGLGNPHAMQLPRCQVERIGELAGVLSDYTFDWAKEDQPDERRSTKVPFIWVDTLCCPTTADDSTERLKQAAMNKLREVYQNATYVLVLDRMLQLTVSRDMDMLEVGMRIITSRWMQRLVDTSLSTYAFSVLTVKTRLWTFQEAVLPKKLLVLFEDQVIDVKEIWHALKVRKKSSVLGSIFTTVIIYSIVQIRAWLYLEESETLNLDALYAAVRHRRVTKLTDEAICLAVALNLDVSEITRIDGAERMPALWRMIASERRLGIPGRIIFNTLPRLSNPGHRWAPASFQIPLTERGIQGLSNKDVSETVLSSNGLVVRRAGMRIQAVEQPPGFQLDSPNPILAQLIYVRHNTGDWYTLMIDVPIVGTEQQVLGHLLQDRSRDWHLILDQWQGSVFSTSVLLVYPERKSGSVIYRTVATALLNRLDPSWEALYEASIPHWSALRQHRINRIFQTIRFCERVTRSLVWFLPSIFQRWTKPFTEWIFHKLTARLHHNASWLLIEEARKMGTTPKVADILERLHPAGFNAAVQVGGTIRSGVTGFHAEVLETFGSTHEWCVD